MKFFINFFEDASPWDIILFSYTTKVIMLGHTAESLEIGGLAHRACKHASSILIRENEGRDPKIQIAPVPETWLWLGAELSSYSR